MSPTSFMQVVPGESSQSLDVAFPPIYWGSLTKY